MKLSNIELEILKRLALPNQEISEELNYSIGSIKSHIHQLIGKLNGANRVHTLFQGLRKGIIKLEDIVL